MMSVREMLDKDRLAPVVLGVFLVISVFIPWLQSPAISGLIFDPVTGLVGLLGGILVVFVSWTRNKKIKGSVYFSVGILGLLLLVTTCFASPQIEAANKQGLQALFQVLDTKIDFGLILYGLISFTLIFSGLEEIKT